MKQKRKLWEVASKNVFKKELIVAGYNPNSEIRSKKIVSLFLDNEKKGLTEEENIVDILSQFKIYRTEVKKILLTKGYIKKEI